MKKKMMALAALAAPLILAGCPTADIGGWIESVDSEGKNTKATFGGSFSCSVVGTGIPEPGPQYQTLIEGGFVYHDHKLQIDWKGKTRDLSFYGVVVDIIGPIGPTPDGLCELRDSDFVDIFGAPDGYCGPVTLKPAPKSANDTGYDQDLAYRISVTDGGLGGDDTLEVWVGPRELTFPVGGCPINKNGQDNDDASDCMPGDFCYHNQGVLRGGQVVMN